MKKIVLIFITIVFIICTSYKPLSISAENKLLKVETSLDEIEEDLRQANVMISDPKRLNQIKKNNK